MTMTLLPPNADQIRQTYQAGLNAWGTCAPHKERQLRRRLAAYVEVLQPQVERLAEEAQGETRSTAALVAQRAKTLLETGPLGGPCAEADFMHDLAVVSRALLTLLDQPDTAAAQ
jgi:hypothetical protein